MKNNLTIFGSIEFCNSKFKGKKLSKTCIGGNGVLAALAASKKTPVDVIGVIGTDLDKKYLAKILGPKINLDNILQLDGSSFHYGATYDPKSFELLDEDIKFGVYGNCSPKVSTEKVKNSKLILFSGSSPKYGLMVLKQIKGNPIVGFNTLLYHLKNNYQYSIRLIKKSTYLFTNQQEYQFLQEKFGKDLFKKFKNLKFIFRTLGKHGVLVETKNSSIFFPSDNSITPKDPTNAGDVFTGTLMGLVASGVNLEKELKNNILDAQKESIKVLLNDKFYRKEI